MEEAMSRFLPQLPLEIIIEILSRLPVKPLFRFKSVCKSWFSLISNNPEFAKTHLHYAKQDTDINRYRLFLSTTYPFQSIDPDAYCNGCNYAVARELPYPTAAARTAGVVEVFGSCNGLIAAALNLEHSHIIVWNPTTGDSKGLPISDLSMKSGEVFSGFGYDSILDDYKVVRGAAPASGSQIKMEVFNLKANKWRTINNLHSKIALNDKSISTNGYLHWLVNVGIDRNRKLGIVSFDLAEEEFLEMVTIPDDVIKNMEWGSRIQRVGEELCVCTHWYAEWCEGWIMKRHGKEIVWSKLYSCSSDPLPGCKYWIEVIWVTKNGRIVFDLDGREIVVYSPQDKSLLEYGVEWDVFAAITYMETLVSPNVA